MAARGVTLASNASLNGAQSAAVLFNGGRAALVTNATAYGTTVNLQLLGPSGAWFAVGTAVTADGLQALDLPAGQYRINSVGSTTGLYAALVAIPYT